MSTAKVFKSKFITAIFPSKFDEDKHCFGLKGVDGFMTIPSSKGKTLNKGDTVTVKAVKGKKDWTVKGIKVVEAAKSGGGGGGRRGGGGGGYNNDPKRQASIVMQHSQEMAARVVAAGLAADVWKLPAQAKRENFVIEKLEELTILFYGQAQGEGLDLLVKKIEELNADAVDDDEDDDDDEEEFEDDDDDDSDEDDDDFDDDFDND